MTLLILMSWMFSMIFIFLNHPLSLGGILLLQTIIISLMTGMLNMDFWFSYILFLIMIGGMLILFIYMTSIASNEKFKLSKNIIFISMLFTLMMSMMMFMDKYPTFIKMSNYEMLNMVNLNINLSMNKLMNMPSMLIMMLLMIYLLVTLIAIVKISQMNKGPLRSYQ